MRALLPRSSVSPRKRIARAVAIVALAIVAVPARGPVNAASGWPANANIVVSWRDPHQTIASVDIRSERTKNAGAGWFKLKSGGDFTFNCNTIHGREFEKKGDRLVATHTMPVSKLYCDGMVITARIAGLRAGAVYGLAVTTDPMHNTGTRSISGTAQVTQRRQTAIRTIVKSVNSGAADIDFPSAYNGGPRKLTWSAEFQRDSKHDLAVWHVSNNTTYGAAGGSTNVMRAGESNVRVEDNRLRIQSRKIKPTPSTLWKPFSSGYLTSDYLLDLSKPGRLDAKIKPNLVAGTSKGKWPGLWLRNRGRQELDITEMIGTSRATAERSNQFQTTAHVDTTGHDPRKVGQVHSFAGTSTQFHLWSTVWDGRGDIKVSCDGVIVAMLLVRDTPWMGRFTGGFQIRLDQFVQGAMPGPVDASTTFDDAFEVAYLRYYR